MHVISKELIHKIHKYLVLFYNVILQSQDARIPCVNKYSSINNVKTFFIDQ